MLNEKAQPVFKIDCGIWIKRRVYFIRIILTVTTVILTSSLYAQNRYPHRLRGMVCDSLLRKPLAGVTIVLTAEPPGKLQRHFITDSSGRFIIDSLLPGTWKLNVSGIAYKALLQTFIMPKADLALDTIFLAGRATTLQEVTVSSKKPFLERHIDKVVLNVESSPLAAGGSVMDVLQTSPGVTVNDNVISLKGKKGVTILIDGRPSTLSTADMSNILQSLPASSIARIEIIANPSSRYDAAGNGGIINIVTKRTRSKGFNGTLNASSGFGVYPKYNGGGNFNLRQNKLNLFGNYYINRNTGFNNYSNKSLIDSVVFDETGRSKTTRTAHNYQLGMELTGKKSTIGFSMTGNNSESRFDENFNTAFIKTTKDSSLVVNNLTGSDYNNTSWNLNQDLRLDTLGRSLSTNIDYSRFIWHNNGLYNNNWLDQQDKAMRDPETFRNNSRVLIKIASARTDYTQRLKGTNMTFNAGIKVSRVRTDSDIQFNKKNGTGWEQDNGKTNHFVFDEYITAGYVSMNRKIGAYEVQAGLRAEHTHNKGNLLTGNVTSRNDYLKCFPTLFISKELKHSQSVSFSYGKRINRPSYEDLNPFIYYNSPYSFYQGNSFLRPEISHNFELGYSLKNELLVSFSYSHTKDYFTYLSYLNDTTKVKKETINNFREYVSYGASISYDKALTDWWNVSANLDVYHEAFNSFYRTQNFKMSIISVNSNLTTGFSFAGNNSFELTGIYRSPTIDGIKRSYARYRIDAGFKKSWLNKSLILKLAVRDIFYTYTKNGNSRIENLNTTFFNRGDTRIFSIDLTYKFGNQKLKARKPGKGNNEEMKRIKGLD